MRPFQEAAISVPSITLTESREAQRVDRCVRGSAADRVGRVKFIQLDALAVGRAQHRQRRADILESDQLADVGSFDRRLALELEAKFDEERLHCFEIVDHDEDVVHPFDRHRLPLPFPHFAAAQVILPRRHGSRKAAFSSL